MKDFFFMYLCGGLSMVLWYKTLFSLYEAIEVYAKLWLLAASSSVGLEVYSVLYKLQEMWSFFIRKVEDMYL